MKKGFVYIAFLGLLAASCAKDLGNYNYHTLLSPTVTGIDTRIDARKNERLQLAPNIEGEGFDASNCRFEWKAISVNDADSATVIGTERELDYLMLLPEGAYTLYFTITDRPTGVFWQTNYELWVTQVTSEGWMVLCSDNGKTRLDMISAVTGQTYRDVLSNTGIPELNGPRRIQQLKGYTEEDSPFYLLTDEGATRLGNDGFAWKEEYSLHYEMGQSHTAIPYEMVTTAGGKMMVSGTDFYYASTRTIIELFGMPRNKDFRVAPMAGSNVASSSVIAPLVLMYDIDNKRFMGYGHLLAGEDFNNMDPLHEMNEMAALLDDLTEGGVIGSAFDVFPTGYDYVYMENTRYDPGNGKMGVTYTVLSDGEKRHLYGIQLGDMLPQSWTDCQSALGKAYYGDLSACTDITKVSDLFAFSSLKNCMYYAVGSTLYRVDLSAAPLRAERQFTLPNGEQITRLKFNLYRNTANQNRSYDLVVGSLKGEEGILRIYRDNALEGDFSKVEPEVYGGFARIVDATYREW